VNTSGAETVLPNQTLGNNSIQTDDSKHFSNLFSHQYLVISTQLDDGLRNIKGMGQYIDKLLECNQGDSDKVLKGFLSTKEHYAYLKEQNKDNVNKSALATNSTVYLFFDIVVRIETTEKTTMNSLKELSIPMLNYYKTNQAK